MLSHRAANAIGAWLGPGHPCSMSVSVPSGSCHCGSVVGSAYTGGAAFVPGGPRLGKGPAMTGSSHPEMATHRVPDSFSATSKTSF